MPVKRVPGVRPIQDRRRFHPAFWGCDSSAIGPAIPEELLRRRVRRRTSSRFPTAMAEEVQPRRAALTRADLR
jgi:hypothetical protein